jgi:predicted DNA-binding ribbon-helix-helix protein
MPEPPSAETADRRVRKRSIVLNGHGTSISLEDSFWSGAREIAAARGTSLRALLEQIDAARGEANLSSAIRVAVLAHFRELARSD